MIMRKFLIILICTSFFQLKAQQNMVGNWELYDTLSISQVKLGDNILNKLKLIHKELTLNVDSTFSLKHIEPKGFSINADIVGTWQVNNSEVILLYENLYENQKGEKKKEMVKDRLIIIDKSKMRVEQDLFFYNKKD